MSVTFVRAADAQQDLAALVAYYEAVGRLGSEDVAAEAEHLVVAWEDGYEPEPSLPLKLLISPPVSGRVVIAFRKATTFDLPFTAWLARESQSETSDMHLRQTLRGVVAPFDDDEDRSVREELSGWREFVIPPRPWPPLAAAAGREA